MIRIILNKEDVALKESHSVYLDVPPLYNVVLLNDDYTPMDFVVFILESVFHKSSSESEKIMLAVHHHGSAVCGVYSYEVAETKMMEVVSLAREKEYPLQCIIEKE